MAKVILPVVFIAMVVDGPCHLRIYLFENGDFEKLYVKLPESMRIVVAHIQATTLIGKHLQRFQPFDAAESLKV